MDKEQRKRAEEKSTRGASSSSSISPKATGLHGSPYDVFLNFRGSDTRKAFTDHLYHNLVKAGTVPFWVFRDENSIPIGEEFGSEILDAIKRSKISIPVISENYASSKWCLHELVHIMECKKSTSHIVLPIFYKVAPSDVRHLKGNFGNAFHLRWEHYDEKDIQEWQRALNEVSYLHGWESDKFEDGHEGELIEHVVETVQSKLQEDFQLNVPKQLVGPDDGLKKIMNWIDSPSINARMIGIYGMGGIGKTTLARIICNQLSNKFGHVSFLPDVRETTERYGITYLQSQLISDILPSKIKVSRVDDGINIIKSRFKQKKVLILLDDIDDKNQLDALAGERNWFMVGSLIIVTTRNKAVLDQSEFEVDYKYELNGLDEVHALLLFNRHAFRADHSPKDFDGISRDIISTMGGLPLALEVVGSYLYKKKNKGVWEDVQKKLKNQPHRDVQKILQISYDALEDGHKQIFLDIACFFIDIRDNGKAAMYMWEDCGFYPNQGIEELKLRCLIKIGDNGKFMMHDQLRALGRSIFCQGQPLKKCSGPWDDKYAGVPRVLRLSERHPQFHDFPGAASSGDSKFSEVRWLTWDFPGKTSGGGITEIWKGWKSFNLHLSKLSVLVLWEGNTRGGITENWKGWKSFKASKQLKVLNVQQCANLRCTPELSTYTQLKILNLSCCGRLKHLHPSIGKLTSLVTLDLSFCRNLKKLLEEVGGLKDLEELSLNHSGITAIPSSLGSLRKLKTLSAFMCRSLREIPSSIGDLQNLQNLNLQYTAIEKLPNAIGGLKNLQFLNLIQCSSLKGAIPSEIGDLPSLKTIYLSHSSISKLPESLRNLSSLRSLELSGCKQLWSLPGLPSSLRSLYLMGCKELWSLPELPSGLTYLFITCQRLGLPQLLRLTHPETLYLDVRYLLEDIRKLSSITLKLCFEEWDKLTSLSLHGLTHLEELSIKKCSSIKRLDLSGLIHLKRLCIEHCKLTSLPLHGLTHLEELSIKKCSSIKRLDVLGLIHLKRLRIEHCDSLVEIMGHNLKSLKVIFLDECKRLKKLSDFNCGNLVEIQAPDGAKFLEELDLTGSERLQSLVDRDCKKLTQL